ncbi:hypothetical protein NA56DRAFT_712795 [Hyaloscypha hepaticicola]|uniref:Uncharacterized protein n=1 Tax=Hyaloscypha hepaticicola TaxID=2082293 RepID=A0A2J6PFA7_9HELO|nr:hypothetical protein NA56DRAFT_712795 [Hyaloscypha hepaticicola]
MTGSSWSEQSFIDMLVLGGQANDCRSVNRERQWSKVEDNFESESRTTLNCTVYPLPENNEPVATLRRHQWCSESDLFIALLVGKTTSYPNVPAEREQ